MTDLAQYLYKSSISDIVFNVENIEYFRHLKTKFEYSLLGAQFAQTLRLLKNEQKLLLEAHDLRYCEKVDVGLIKDNLKSIGMRKSKALTMIGQIERSGLMLRESERVFIRGIKESSYGTLSIKQAEWLNKIYAEVGV